MAVINTTVVQSSLLRSSVLEPNLNDPHRQAGFLRQFLPHVSRRLRRSSERSFENFELLRLDGRSWTSSLPVSFILAVLVQSPLVIHLLVGLFAIHVCSLGRLGIWV